jgi:AAA ATPase domain
MSSHVAPDPFIGRRQELARLAEAIRRRESLLIWGPRDSGKTAMLTHAIASLPEKIARQCVRVCARGSLRNLLQDHVVQLYELGDPLVRAKFAAEARGPRSSVHSWARTQPSVRLRGLLYRAAREGRYCIFWDDVPVLGHAHLRVAKNLIWACKTPVSCLARGRGESEIGLGARLYWHDGLRLHLGPLPLPEAAQLLEQSIERWSLAALDLARFREEILGSSALLPGAIVRMTALAARPRYQSDGQIKTKLIRVDYLFEEAPLRLPETPDHERRPPAPRPQRGSGLETRTRGARRP